VAGKNLEPETWNLEHQPKVGVIVRSDEKDECDVAISTGSMKCRICGKSVFDFLLRSGFLLAPGSWLLAPGYWVLGTGYCPEKRLPLV